MGLSLYQVEFFYSSGLIDALPQIGKRDWPRFAADAPLTFEAKLRQVSSENLIAKCLMSLADVPTLHQESLVDVIKKVFSGKIACQVREGTKPLFQRTMVDAQSLRDDGLGVRSAAAVLGTHERMIPHLNSAGFLNVDQRWNRRYRSLSIAELEIFRSQYVLTREVAAHLKTSTRTAIQLMKNAGIEPVITHSTSLQISAVWPRLDVQSVGLLD